MRLALEFEAVTPVRTPSFPGYAIVGALNGRLRAVSSDATQPAEMRHHARVVNEWHQKRLSAPGVHERTSVLTVPRHPLALCASERLRVGLTLFGAAMEPGARAYAAAGELELNRRRLELTSAALRGPDTLGAASRRDAQRLVEGGGRLRFETPAILVREGALLDAPSTLEPLAVFACKALEAVSGIRAPAGAMGRLLDDARASPLAVEEWCTGVVRGALGRGRDKRCVTQAAVSSRPLSPELARLLAAATITHMGQSTTFGFGRFTMPPD